MHAVYIYVHLCDASCGLFCRAGCFNIYLKSIQLLYFPVFIFVCLMFFSNNCIVYVAMLIQKGVTINNIDSSG